MIIVHEFGHWVVARKLGFQTPIFGFGLPFGGHIRLGNWKETEFRFHYFVLGGYVAIPELGDESTEELLKEVPNLKPMQTFPVWKRATVASAGVLFNLIFAYLICLIMVATVGPPSAKGNVMITNLLDANKKAISFNYKPNPIAKLAGLKAGDVILEIDHLKINEPSQVVKIVREHALQNVNFKIKRTKIIENKKHQEVLNINVTPNKEGTIGIAIGLARSPEYDKPSKNPLVWLMQAMKVLISWTVTMLFGLWIMIVNLFGFSVPGAPKIEAEDLHGIIAIVSVFAQAITIDFKEIFRWTALISVNLAIINLLPIPALDGGHLLFMFIEKIRGKKIAESIQQRAIQTGFLILIVFMFFVLFNDVKGLVTGKFDMNTTDKEEKGSYESKKN